jgi:hypothetical protein
LHGVALDFLVHRLAKTGNSFALGKEIFWWFSATTGAAM